jgi:hypothetical protein
MWKGRRVHDARTVPIPFAAIQDFSDHLCKIFADEGHLASYFGIVPRVSNSNETEQPHSQTRDEAGTHGAGAVGSDRSQIQSLPERFYEQVKARRGAGKAIIALARKFLGVINWTLKNGWVFEDFPNFVLAEAHSGTHHRESKTTQFLRLAKDANQIAVDKTS